MSTLRTEEAQCQEQQAEAESWQNTVSALDNFPRLLVFDLDGTLWTPELYQIRKRTPPTVEKDIRLFPEALEILRFCRKTQENSLFPHKVEFAIASRTNKRDWAEQLLDDFSIPGSDGAVPLRSLFQYIEIRTGSKKQHLANLRQGSGVPYSSMLFLDDDARMNLGESSQLGVLSCHTPRGITVEYFVKALAKYSELKTGHDDNHWMGYILNAENLGIKGETMQAGKRCNGRVKLYSAAKRFGFVSDEATGQEFFVHESKVPMEMKIQAGDIVDFETSTDGQGRPSAAILDSSSGRNAQDGNSSKDMVSLPCFTMSQPFAALLLNGVKTVESRNNAMFEVIKPGTRVLLHCGRKDWHDQESYLEILQEKGYSPNDIAKVNRLPKGFPKGAIIGVITVGKTWRAKDQERRGKDLQNRVLAPFEGVGRFCTEVTDAQWLKRPIKTRGKPGVSTVQIPKDAL
jgi:magnesium-dependent phosphatase 1